MSWVFAIIQVIPIFDKWADRGWISYKDWKNSKGKAKIDADIDSAKKGEAEDLQKDLGGLSE